MKQLVRALLGPSLGAALLAGCATSTYVSPVEVTRFVGQSPQMLGNGPIAVRAGAGVPADSFEQAAFEAAVRNELAQLGYLVGPGTAQQVAEVWVERSVAAPRGSRSPVGVGVGGSTGSYGSGVGMGVGVDLGSLIGGSPREQIERQLRVLIRPAAGGPALWEGRARFSASANAPAAEQRAAAARLADALFAGFPGRSGETIEVR